MKFKQPTKQNLAAWKTWLADRPQCIRDAVEKYKLDPWTLYKLNPRGTRVTLASLSEPALSDGKVTVRVGISGEFNLVTFQRDVMGIDPADLEECDLPKPDEQIGSLEVPVDVLRNLRDQYADDVPSHVMVDLIARYPLQHFKNGEKVKKR